jgi:hypothetical protein
MLALVCVSGMGIYDVLGRFLLECSSCFLVLSHVLLLRGQECCEHVVLACETVLLSVFRVSNDADA